MPVGGVFPVGQAPLPAVGQSAQIHLVDPSDPTITPLAKSIMSINGQSVLVEEINFVDIQAQLKSLGLAAAPRTEGKVVEFAARGQLLPPPRKPKPAAGSIQLASGPYTVKGVAMDPYTTLSGSASSYSFSANTFFIPTNYYLGPGGVTFQNNTVIKFGTNANLLVYGTVTFPGYGSPVVFTSKDDDSFGVQISGSTGIPGYAGYQELDMYYPTNPGVLQTALFRWAQRGLQYDENIGATNSSSVLSCKFENSLIGLYQNTGGATLNLTNDTYCVVQTPRYYSSGNTTGAVVPNCGVVDASKVPDIESEPSITVAPSSPNHLCMVANSHGTSSVGWSRSSDGGATWSSFTSFPGSSTDPSAVFDAFGNLFVSYLTPSRLGGSNTAVLLLSTNYGVTFETNAVFDGIFDQPHINVGPGPTNGQGSVWITLVDEAGSNSIVSGAVVTGLHAVGPWSNAVVPNTGPGSGTLPFGDGDIAVGPTGQVAVVLQQQVINPPTTAPTPIRVSVNPTGRVNPSNFSPAVTVHTSNVGFLQLIPAVTTPARGISPKPWLAWDRSGGPHNGRLYLVYADSPASGSYDIDVYVILSDDNGSSWSSPLKINTDGTATSHFFPRIAIDQSSGNVAVSWYDCRADTANNVLTTFYASVSKDGGSTWGDTFSANNIQLEPGQSSLPLINNADVCVPPYSVNQGYGDYTASAFQSGYFYAAWADNSNTTGSNPDKVCATDIYVARVHF